jgi:hypothetical protein
MTLAFAAAATRPAAVLTGPPNPAGTPSPARAAQAVGRHGLVPIRLEGSPLRATAGLVWNSDLPRPLQQLLFDTADSLSLPATSLAS